jgi:hypothetical protein
MAYDEKCAELAEYFLTDDARIGEVVELAQVIQDAIEEWLRSEE